MHLFVIIGVITVKYKILVRGLCDISMVAFLFRLNILPASV